MKLLLLASMLMAPLCSALGNTYPIKLLDSGVNDGKTVSFGEPRAIYDSALNKYICLFQQGDGNFRVLRSATIQDCEDNVGTLLYHSDFSVPGSGPYFTSMQVDGNLITRKQVNEQWVWKTHSSQGMIEERFCLVLNADGTLSILDENDNTIWNSEMDEVRFFNRPLRLMTTLPDNPSRAWFIRPIKVRDALQDSYVCVIQQGDGNFRVIRGDDCENNTGSLIFHSDLVYTLPNNEKYWTHLQRDGNLVTRRELSKKWEWATCSGQGAEVFEEFSLVLTSNDTLQIVDESGMIIWDSVLDESCFKD